MSDLQLVSLEKDALVISTPYNSGFVASLKSEIPYTNRKWDTQRKVWLVTPDFYNVIANLVLTHYRVKLNIQVPIPTKALGFTELRIFECRYIGATKDRGGGERTALGWTGTWNIIFPENVLKMWVGVELRPGGETTLYARLGVRSDASTDEVKSAYRKMAKTWHPDICHDPDASAQFQAIPAAYEILGDPDKRIRYNVGLALEWTLSKKIEDSTAGYRCPIRCGQLIVTGNQVLDKFNVQKIDSWMDIKDAFGRILVPSWPMGAEMPVEEWL